MGTVAVTQNITMDGSIEFLGDWFDPTADQSVQLELLHEQSARSDALLVGRKTFEDFRSYWRRRVRLYTYPVVQGRGRRLFPDGYPETHLRLTDSRSFRAGVTHSRYRAN